MSALRRRTNPHAPKLLGLVLLAACYLGALLGLAPLLLLATWVPCWALRSCCLLLGCPAAPGAAVLLAAWASAAPFAAGCCLLLGCPAGPGAADAACYLGALQGLSLLGAACYLGALAAPAVLWASFCLLFRCPAGLCVARAAGCYTGPRAAGAFGNIVFSPVCLLPAVSPHPLLPGNDVYGA